MSYMLGHCWMWEERVSSRETTEQILNQVSGNVKPQLPSFVMRSAIYYASIHFQIISNYDWNCDIFHTWSPKSYSEAVHTQLCSDVACIPVACGKEPTDPDTKTLSFYSLKACRWQGTHPIVSICNRSPKSWQTHMTSFHNCLWHSLNVLVGRGGCWCVEKQ